MKNLQDATERICDLKGSLVALDALMESLDAHAEVARTVMLHTAISEHTLQAFERDVGRMASLISAPPPLADEGHVG